MRPAFSLIIFTTLSGLGFGLAAILGLGLITAPDVIWQAGFHGIALVLIGIGILSSTFHLGHPERAWRALTQWRSSWLSREGVLAALTSGLFIIYAIDALYNGAPNGILGLVIAALSLITIWCTAMIYASLKTVARWHHFLTPFVFIGYALAGGLLLAAGLDTVANGGTGQWGGASVMIQPALAALLGSALIAIIWSKQVGAKSSASTPETATGLGALGEVRMLMPPHSEENWLQHEMGFIVARKHASTLHRISLIMALAFPVLGLAFAGSQAGMLIIAILVHTGGVMISRWLFFAEAKHTVMLYYGQRH